MRLALKIILLIVVLIAALFPAVAMIVLLMSESARFELSMLVPFGLSTLGILSFVYQIKTVSIYKLLNEKVLLPKPNKIFWGLNLAYAASLLLLAIWFVYMIVQTTNLQLRDRDLIYFSILVGIPTTLASVLFFEAYFVKEKIKQNKAVEIFLEIDNIKGDSESQNY